MNAKELGQQMDTPCPEMMADMLGHIHRIGESGGMPIRLRLAMEVPYEEAKRMMEPTVIEGRFAWADAMLAEYCKGDAP